jgi:hypothetical protein
MMDIKQYLHKYKKGNGKWKTLEFLIFFIKELIPALIGHVKTHLRENVWTCEPLSRTMDLRHGINLSGVDSLRGMDPLHYCKNGAARSNTNSVLWSSGSIKNCMRDVEKTMTEKIGWKAIHEIHDEKLVDGVKLDTDKLFTYLINAFHLSDIALNESVEIALTVDGAKLDDQVHHITTGFKICDKRARGPVSGKMIFDETPEKGNL